MTTEYGYDAVGNLVRQANENVTLTYRYDLNGRMTEESRTEGRATVRTSYGYDLTRPYYDVLTETVDGEVTSYTYGLERLTAYTEQTQTKFLYDGRGSVIQTMDSQGTEAMA